MLYRQAAVARLSREMVSSEQSIAAALVDATALMHSCAIAARDNTAPPAKVHATFQRVQKMATALVQARSEAVRTHNLLLDIHRETCGPEEPNCPDNAFTTGENSGETIAA